jgi:putative hydrolase of the HAD superfamily
MSFLLIDADDTLWENNIYFESAFDEFADFLDHSALTPAQVRDVLNEIELVNAKIHGYGARNFGRNLQQAYQATVALLASRHDLTLFTKGHPEEQKLKVDRSGLGCYFAHTAIVREKDTAAYLRIVEERGLAREDTWMIGNSPKSDINPALEAGLGAVLVPHPHTWVLEHQELRTPEGARFMEVEKFSELLRIF